MSIIGSLPYTFVNGQTADATQVNADFNTIVNNVNSNAANAGANTNITSLGGLTTPIAPTAGGSTQYIGGVATGTGNAIVVASTIPSNFALTAGNTITFVGANINTGATTLDVNTLGAITLQKPTPSGLGNLQIGDIIPGAVFFCYYNGTTFEVVNVIYEPVQGYSSTSFDLDFSNFLENIVCTAAQTIILPQTATLANYFACQINAQGGAVTLAPFTGDIIQGGVASANFIIPQGKTCELYTDAAGKWLLNDLPTIFSATTTGASYTYTLGDNGNRRARSNSTSAMTDALPGTVAGVLPNGWYSYIYNADASATITLTPASGATIDGGSSITIAAGRSALVSSDGSNYFTLANTTAAATNVAAGTPLTSSQTWTSPANTTSATVFKITLTAPGGGGGGTAGGTVAAGGGGGGTCILYKSGVAASTGYVYTQGTTGAGGASGANDGTAGGNSSFVIAGTTMNANGGGAGTHNGLGGVGGTASNGSINTGGGNGGNGLNSNSSIPGGMGGNSIWGGAGGGGGPGAGLNAGTNALGYGSGGGGAGNIGGSNPTTGGNGFQGILLIERLSG